VLYGLFGWCAEIAYTGVASALHGEGWRLTGTTYLWMFPIYAAGAVLVLEPLHDRIRSWRWWWRGLSYVPVVWAIEYATGALLVQALGYCPWDYSGATRWHIDGLIRLDFAPLWCALGLVFERVHDWLFDLEKAHRSLREPGRRTPLALLASLITRMRR
jgi:hypothetical protein